MSTVADRFLALHVAGTPLLIPNPWDLGSAKLLVDLGFTALATTSSGFALSLGRPDGSVSHEEALAHAAAVVGAVDVPVSADLKNCFVDAPDGAAQTVRSAAATGLAGCSIEDWSGTEIYPLELATDRVRAAAQAAHSGPGLVLTARAENHLHGHDDGADFADTIARLQSYAEAGADVLYAPGLTDLGQIRTLVREVDRPVNVLAMAAAPPVAALADAGVARVSVGGTFAFAALGALVTAARELRERGTYGYTELSAAGRAAAGRAFG